MSTSQASATARHARPPDCSHPSAPPKLAVSRAPAASRPTHGRRPSRRSSSAGRPSTSCSGATPFSAMTSRTTQRAFRKRLPGSGRPTRKAATVIRALSSRFATATLGVALALSGFVVAACGSDDSSSTTRDATDTTDPAGDAGGDGAEPVIDPGDGGNYQPDVDPADFVDVIDHPYLPYAPGSSWTYEGTDDGETVSTEGSWEAGVDGALPGIVTPAQPAVGDAYRQEFYAGEAEDLAEVARLGASETVPFGDLDDLVVIKEWNPLEPEVVEEKYFARGIGLVVEVKTAGGEGRVELLEHTSGP